MPALPALWRWVGFLALLAPAFVPPAQAVGDDEVPLPGRDSPYSCRSAKQARFSGPAPVQGPPDPPTDFDVSHYDIAIAVDFDAQILTGAVEITAVSLVAELAQLLVDLQEDMSCSSITCEGVPLSFVHEGDRLQIALDRPYGLGEQLTVRVAYSGHPVQAGLVSFSFDTHGGYPIASSLSEPWFARNWWPCKETPTDKATADISFTVPSEMIAATNGTLFESIENGETTTYRWTCTYPIATYLISAAITNYATFSDVYITASGDAVPVDHYVYPEHLETAQASFPIVIEQMDYFRTVYGAYPFAEEKYGMAEFPWGGAMEHQTLTSMGECCLDYPPIIAHELAHQWWGDMVTCGTWHDIWLNEGFATYSEALWYGSLDPPDGYGAYMAFLNDDGGFPGPIYRYDLSDPWDLFSYVVYDKGAWVLHMLRGVVGDEVFFDGLISYRTAFEYSSAITEDLENVFEAESGMTLDWFFDEWIYGENRPDYEYSWSANMPDPGSFTLTVTQVQQNAPPFKMPIQIDVETASGTERFTVWDSLESQQFVLQVSDEPTGVRFDPDDWILDWHREVSSGVVGPEASAPAARLMFTDVRPQPASSGVTLTFRLPGAGPGRWVDVGVYDVSGRRLSTLLSEDLTPGEHTLLWDGKTDAGNRAAAGIYFARLVSGGLSDVQRVVMVR